MDTKEHLTTIEQTVSYSALREVLADLANGDVSDSTNALFRALVEQLPGTLYLADAEHTGMVRYASQRIEQHLRYTAREWLVDPYFWQTRLHPDDRDTLLKLAQEYDGGGESYDIQYRLLHRDGQTVWVRDQGTLIRDSNGTPLYWLGFVLDITEQRLAQDAVAEAEERFRPLVENIPAVIFTVGIEHAHTPTYMSPQVETMFGYSLSEWESDPEFWLKIVHPGDLDEVLDVIRRTAETGDPYTQEFRMIASDGSVVWVQNDATLIRDARGTPLYWQGVLVDITGRRIAEDALREAESRYRTLVEQISLVTYVQPLDGAGLPSYISPQIEELLGYPRSHWYDHPDISGQAVHPDDFERWKNEVLRTDASGEPFDMEHRMLRADGSVIWVRNRALLVNDKDGVPRYWQGTLQDITDTVLAEQRLAESEQRYRSLFENNPHPVCSFDLNGNMLSANAALSELTGYPPSELIGASFRGVVRPEDLDEVELLFALAASGVAQDFEKVLLHQSGEEREVHVTFLPIMTDGDIVGVYAILNDISERKDLERKLKQMAFHDPLTGLPNRRLLIDRIDRAVAGLARHPGTIALLFIDMDNFKSLNDRLGHDVGDLALQVATRSISDCVKSTDTVARFGGDEFAVLLNDLQSLNEAVDVANRILERLSRPHLVEGHALSFTASIGMVTTSSPSDAASELLRRGDMAMYQAKTNGRAGYSVYREDPVVALN